MDETSSENQNEVSPPSVEKQYEVSPPPPSKTQRGLHGPSLGIGAGIAIVSIISAFFAISVIDESPELEFEENALQPKSQETPPQEGQEVALSVFTANGSPILGNENAPITLIEFGDYQCFFCNKFFHETEQSILKNYVDTGKVKIIFKDFTIIGPDSVSAAEATHCANDQGKYWEYHDALYNNWNGENNGWASRENLEKFADEIDLDVQSFVKCMNDGKYSQLVAASNNDARTLGLTGTPGFFVIGSSNQITKIPGAQPYEAFERIFESELQK